MHAITPSSPGLPVSSHLVCLCSHGEWVSSPSSTPGRVLQCLQIAPPPTREYLCFSWPFCATSSISPKLKRLVGQGKEQGGTNMLELVGIPRYHCLIPPPFGQNLQRGFYTTCAQFLSFIPSESTAIRLWPSWQSVQPFLLSVKRFSVLVLLLISNSGIDGQSLPLFTNTLFSRFLGLS